MRIIRINLAGFVLAALLLGTLVIDSGAQPALDTSFGGGLVTPKVFAKGKYPQIARGAVVQSDGKVVAAMSLSVKYGQRHRRPVLRFGTDGKLDRAYGKNGVAWVPRPRGFKYFGFSGVSLQSDGRALVFGSAERSKRSVQAAFVSRLTRSGKVDESFGKHGVRVFAGLKGPETFRFLQSVAQSDDGRIVLAFQRDSSTGATFQIVRLTRSGKLDIGFAKSGVKDFVLARHAFYAQVTDTQLHGDVIDVLAYLDRETPGPTCRVYRFNLAADGRPVQSFGSHGSVGVPTLGPDPGDMRCSSLAATPDGGLVVAGSYLDIGSETTEDPGFIYKLLANGQADPAFGTSGLVTTDETIRPSTITALDDGTYLLAGDHPNVRTSLNPDYGTATQLDASGKIVPTFGIAGFLKLTPRAYAGAIEHTPGGSALVYSTFREDDFGTSQIAKFTN